jgi:hypothetical protein
MMQAIGARGVRRRARYPALAGLALLAPGAPALAQAAPTAPGNAAAAPAAAAAAAAPCADAEHHQFDFWVGRWDVYRPDGRLVAHSLIESVYGCGIRENWMPLSGHDGGSLSIYVPAEHAWQQYWIDSSGNRVVFTGGFNGSAMIITGTWPASPQATTGPLVRMTYTRGADGSVRQFGEQSTDQGHSWTTGFDFTYRPHRGPSP